VEKWEGAKRMIKLGETEGMIKMDSEGEGDKDGKRRNSL